MNRILSALSALALYLSATAPANAVFSAVPVAEPETAALIIAGGVVALALRRVARRKKDRKRDE